MIPDLLKLNHLSKLIPTMILIQCKSNIANLQKTFLGLYSSSRQSYESQDLFAIKSTLKILNEANDSG